jgi:predicted ATPase
LFQLALKRAELVEEGFYLFKQNWNDYWDFETSFLMIYVDPNGTTHDIGEVKIGQASKNYSREDPKTDVPSSFDFLSDDFFSLGQADSYYEALEQLGEKQRIEALTALRDIAFSAEIFDSAKSKGCTKISLLRFVPPATVVGQFRRLAHGGARLTDYSFSYSFPKSVPVDPSEIQFDVTAHSNPPTNIQVLIGRNGVGKSTLLDAMARSFVLAERPETDEKFGHFSFERNSTDSTPFVNLVSVSFSAFDSFTPISVSRDRTSGPLYEYIGLKKIAMDRNKLKRISFDESAPIESGIKDPAALGAEFLKAARLCMNGAYLSRWFRALSLLDSDPVFASTGILETVEQLRVDQEGDPGLVRELNAEKSLSQLFGKLSSGHKIVLLTITRLVQAVSEKTLVLIDEPEAHLHPPLLSAFTRALSDLLSDRNGVAIVATHSPVILQEVPKSCVWILSRSGKLSKIKHPRTETFGENVGILTSEVFNLEVTATGFHQRLFDASAKASSYEEALSIFGGQLGAEGRILLESMILQKSEV